MGSKRVSDVPTRIGDSPFADKNIRSLRDTLERSVTKAKREMSRSVTENVEKNEGPSLHNESRISLAESLRVCKPVSVYLTRLPDSVVKKNVATSKISSPAKKKRRQLRWKYGMCTEGASRRWRRKLQRMRRLALKALKSPANGETNSTSEGIGPDPVTKCTDLMRFESVTRELSFPTNLEESAIEVNETEQIKEGSGISGPITEITVSKAQEYELSFTIETNEAPHGLDRINESNLSKERKTQITKSNDEPQSTFLGATKEDPKHNSSSPSVQACYQNHKVLSRTLDEDTDRPTSRHAAKRKSLSVSDNGESNERQRSSQRLKKSRCSPRLPLSERVTQSKESKINPVNDTVATIQDERGSLKKLEEHDAKLVQRRRKSGESNSLNKVVVVVNRLDSSHCPLVQKWKEKVESERLDDVPVNSSTSRPINNSSANSTAECLDQNFPEETSTPTIRVEKDHGDSLGPSISVNNGLGQTSSRPLPTVNSPATFDRETNIPNDIVMCDSNEDDSEEDDDEIIEFLSTKRRVKLSIDSSSSENESNDPKFRIRQASRASAKTLSESRSNSRSDLQKTKKHLRSKKSRTSTTEYSSSESSSNSIESRKTRLYCREETRKAPSFHKTRIADWINYSNSEDALDHEEFRSAPLTRSKSRAAVVNASFERTLNANEISQNQPVRESHDRVPTPTYDSSHETSTNEEINEENESRAGNSCAENIQDVESELSRTENDNSLDLVPADRSDLTAIDAVQIERGNQNENCMARKKLTAMKDAMVVLTRLEDLSNLSEDNECSGNEMEFSSTYGFRFSTDYCEDTLRDDTYSNDIDLHSDETRLSCESTDPLEIDLSPISESNTSVVPILPRKSVSPNDSVATKHVSKRTSRQDAAIITRNEDITEDSQDTTLSKQSPESEYEMTLMVDERFSQETTESEVDLTLRVDERFSQETTESEVDLTLRVEERFSQETAESDVELSLFFDEHDKTSTDSLPRNLAEGILTDANGNNDHAMRTPAARSPEDLDEHCKRCHCEEHQRDNRRLKCQNISATHKCITCNSLFKDSELLEQHRTSNAFCNSGFRCTVCQTSFMTLIELAKHRAMCADKGLRRRNSVDQRTNDETSSESRPSEATIPESTQSKDKIQKQPSQKNQSKKIRSRLRCRVNDLTCTVCSVNFETKIALSEHLYKHSSEELQEAFRIRKAKTIASNQMESVARKNELNSINNSGQPVDTRVNSNATVDSGNHEIVTQNFSANEGQVIASNVGAIAATTVSNDSLTSTLATVCLCHRDYDQAPLDKTDLQIEMVLLCKHCQILFRRRECLEVHYRTSSLCAIDRTRERWPRLFCANCQITLNNWADMRHHLEVHARQNAERAIRFVCNICRVVFVGFGTLFYNHWMSHSKDTMFVAGRYNFPKFSVQPIDGTEKLPAGARPDEDYIYVAEHVCPACKKPFSMRRDLEVHQQIEPCNKKNTNSETVKDPKSSRLYCDVCRLTFANKNALNDHSKNEHGNRYTYGATLTSSANDTTLRCTKCSATMPSVSALEEHWKIHSHHNQPSGALDSEKGTPLSEGVTAEPVFVTSSVDDHRGLENRSFDHSTIHSNGVTSSDKITQEPPIITIEDRDDVTVKDSACQTSVQAPISQSISTRTEESIISVSSITSTESTPSSTAHNMPMLNSLLTKPPLLLKNSVEKQRGKIRALEDPCVNIMLSDTSSTNVSASLVIDESEKQTMASTVDSNTDSYQILLSNQASSGNVTMVFSKKRSANSAAEAFTNSTTSQPSCAEKVETVSVNRPDPNATVASERNSTTVAPILPIENTTERCSNGAKEGNNEGKENGYSSNLPGNNQVNVSLGPLLTNRSAVPEIIDIVDDVEESQPRQVAGNTNTAVVQTPRSPVNSLDNNRRNTGSVRECRKSGVNKLHKGIASMKIDSPKRSSVKVSAMSREHSSGSEACSTTGFNELSLSDRPNSHSVVIKASKMSFEERRWNWIVSASAKLNAGYSAATKKQGFLRVKDLSELQAVKTHSCTTCKATFESARSLTEHRQSHKCSGITNKDTQYPTGMSAALVLPDPSERPKTPEKTLTASNNVSTQSLTLSAQQFSYVAQQLVGVLTSGGVAPAEQLTSITVNNEALESWLSMGGQQVPVSLTPQLEMTNSLQNVGTRMDLNSQRLVNDPLNGEVANGVAMSSTSINQQQVITSVGSIGVQNRNQWLPENRTPSLGYHVLPPIVLPSSQSSKYHLNSVAAQRSSSTNYLPTSGRINVSPLTYQPDRQDKYLCNICHIFRCDTIEAFNNHVTKHYTGRKNSTMTQNSSSLGQSPATMVSVTTVTVPSLMPFETRDETTRPILAKSTTAETNSTGNPMIFRNWTVKDTPQGPLLVTPVSSATNSQSLTTFTQINNRSLLRPTPPSLNNPSTTVFNNNGQIVLRCMICKSALYKNYPPLRNHVILVHGITDFNLLGLNNIAQKSYHCTMCPSTSALFDCEENYRRHVDTIHSLACSSCGRVFGNFLTLKQHLEQCRISSSKDSLGNNC